MIIYHVDALSMGRGIFPCNFYFILYFASQFKTRHTSQLLAGTSPQNWKGAQSVCTSSNGYLATLEELNEYKHDPNVTSERRDFWVGHYKTTSSWMDIVGCFSYINNATVNEARTINDKSPGVCEQLCHAFEFFGLKEDNCVCLNTSIWSNKNLIQVESNKCNITCNQQTGLCGGKNEFTFFKRIYPAAGQIRSDACTTQHCDCIESGCLNGGNGIGHFKVACNKNIVPVCRSRIKYNDFVPWSKALNICVKNKSLPFPFIDTTGICSIVQSTPFWTSAFRQYVKLYTNWTYYDDLNIDSVKECMTAHFHGKNIKANWQKNSLCLQEKHFYCIKLTRQSTSSPTWITNNEPNISTAKQKTSEKFSTSANTTGNDIVTSLITVHTVSSNSPSSKEQTDLSSTFKKTDSIAGPIIGAIFAFLVVIGGIITAFICFIRRRKRYPGPLSKENNAIETRKIYSKPNSGEMDQNGKTNTKTQKGFEYDLAVPLRKKEDSFLYDKQKPVYELAHNPNTIVGDIIYSDTIESEYSALHDKTKRKLKNESPLSEENKSVETRKFYSEPNSCKIYQNGRQNTKTQKELDYEFAMPLQRNELGDVPDVIMANDNVYSEAGECEYDVLNDKTKRKIKDYSTENSIYTHAGFKQNEEETYDTMDNTMGIKREDFDTYDTTKLTNKDKVDHSGENPYDRSNI